MIQNYASNLFRGKILVGHSLWNDLAGNFHSVIINDFPCLLNCCLVLGLPHPAVDTRDVALYQVRMIIFFNFFF